MKELLLRFEKDKDYEDFMKILEESPTNVEVDSHNHIAIIKNTGK